MYNVGQMPRNSTKEILYNKRQMTLIQDTKRAANMCKMRVSETSQPRAEALIIYHFVGAVL